MPADPVNTFPEGYACAGREAPVDDGAAVVLYHCVDRATGALVVAFARRRITATERAPRATL